MNATLLALMMLCKGNLVCFEQKLDCVISQVQEATGKKAKDSGEIIFLPVRDETDQDYFDAYEVCKGDR